MPPALQLRPIADTDRAFLLRVYASTREAELAQVPWTHEQKAVFLHSQFDAQHRHYQQHYTDAQFSVVLVDREPAGRLYVQRGEQEIRLIDIALLPAHRGAGVGSSLLHALIEEARAGGKTLSLHVERDNRALGLYQRLGFQQIADTGVYLQLAWNPQADSGSA